MTPVQQCIRFVTTAELTKVLTHINIFTSLVWNVFLFLEYLAI